MAWFELVLIRLTGVKTLSRCKKKKKTTHPKKSPNKRSNHFVVLQSSQELTNESCQNLQQKLCKEKKHSHFRIFPPKASPSQNLSPLSFLQQQLGLIPAGVAQGRAAPSTSAHNPCDPKNPFWIRSQARAGVWHRNQPQGWECRDVLPISHRGKLRHGVLTAQQELRTKLNQDNLG